MNTFFIKIGWSLLVLLSLILPHTAPAADVLYEGADRDQRLIAAAKKEGSLTVYSTIFPRPAGRLRSAP